MSRSPEAIQARLEWGRQLSRKSRLRKTNAFERVLTLLAEAELPLTWTQICEATPIKKQFDPATIFRILEKLERENIVRRMVFRERSSFYSLAIPGERYNYLVCSNCGMIVHLDQDFPLAEVERSVEEKTGFKDVLHQLQFFGLCPKCQAAPAPVVQETVTPVSGSL